MKLHTFSDKKGAMTISADHLDQNFARCKPLLQDGSSAQYRVTETPNGWQLKILPDAPSGGTFVLGFSGGALVWLPTEACG